jgi:hypothetical protein
VYNFRGFEEGSAALSLSSNLLPAITSWRFCGHGGLEEFLSSSQSFNRRFVACSYSLEVSFFCLKQASKLHITFNFYNYSAIRGHHEAIPRNTSHRLTNSLHHTHYHTIKCSSELCARLCLPCLRKVQGSRVAECQVGGLRREF